MYRTRLRRTLREHQPGPKHIFQVIIRVAFVETVLAGFRIEIGV